MTGSLEAFPLFYVAKKKFQAPLKLKFCHVLVVSNVPVILVASVVPKNSEVMMFVFQIDQFYF